MAGDTLLNCFIGVNYQNQKAALVVIYVTAGLLSMTSILVSQNTYPLSRLFVIKPSTTLKTTVPDFHHKVSTHMLTTLFEGVEHIDVGSLSGEYAISESPSNYIPMD